MSCYCNFCKNQNIYNPDDYLVNLSSLNSKKDRGLSGILNTRADELTIEACVESSVEELDELIVTYHCPDDGGLNDQTERIIKKLKEKYPEKIKMLIYRAPIFNSHPECKSSHVRNIHTLANIHNFAMTKASYSHYIRIDGDHIYSKMFLRKISKIIKDEKISHSNTLYYISSINIFPYNGDWYVSKYHDNGMETFAGLGDHIVHPISELYYYISITDENGNTRQHDELEVKHNKSKIKDFHQIWLGLSSLHCKHYSIYTRYGSYKNKRPYYLYYMENTFKKNQDKFIKLHEFLGLEFEDIQFIHSQWFKSRAEIMWNVRHEILDYNMTKGINIL